jgi:hypothetical protein
MTPTGTAVHSLWEIGLNPSRIDNLSPFPRYEQTAVLKTILDQLGLLFRRERNMLGTIASYALGIEMFMLIPPLRNLSIVKFASSNSYRLKAITT